MSKGLSIEPKKSPRCRIDQELASKIAVITRPNTLSTPNYVD